MSLAVPRDQAQISQQPRLLNLLVRLLLSLAEVLRDNAVRIETELELRAHKRLDALHHAVLTLGLLVLILPCAEDVLLALAGNLQRKRSVIEYSLLEL